MSQYWKISDSGQYDNFLAEVGRRRLAGLDVWVSFEKPTDHRTAKQSRCMHGWLDSVAEFLNANGLDARVVLNGDLPIEWYGGMAKEKLWRPVQEAMTGKHSTKDPSTTDYPKIYETLCKHFAEKHGVVLPPWPTRFPPMV